MNTRMKWTQLISVAVLVALASIFTTGLVAADTPPVNADQAHRARRAQYHTALKQVQRDHDWERFVQYLATLEQSASRATSASTAAEMYRAALKQVELDHNWARFEQFLNR